MGEEGEWKGRVCVGGGGGGGAQSTSGCNTLTQQFSLDGAQAALSETLMSYVH